MKKSKIFVFSGLIALSMIFSVLFGFNTNNIKSVYASSLPTEITNVAITGANDSYTVGETVTTPTLTTTTNGVTVGSTMLIESNKSSLGIGEMVPKTSGTYSADKYYYLLTMINNESSNYEFGDNTSVTINGKTARIFWTWADEINGYTCIVPYDKTTGQLKNYDCPEIIPTGFTALENLTITGAPESFVVGEEVPVDIDGDDFVVSLGASIPTEGDYFVEWYKTNTKTLDWFTILTGLKTVYTEGSLFDNSIYYIEFLVEADIEHNYCFTEATNITVNGKQPAYSKIVNDGVYAYVYYEVPKACFVSFDSNGGSGTMATQNTVSGSYTLPTNSFTAPTGKQFKGWSTSSTGEIINSATYDLTGDITLYAIWEDVPATNYLIRFNANGASGNMSNVQANGEYTLPTCTFTAPIGKIFKGWALTSDGEVIEGTTINVTGDITLHAIWEDIEPQQPPVSPEENNGLGAGAIVGIILASLVVVGIGGFAIFWFVVKKKNFADLGKAFKSLWAKIKNLFKKKNN